MEKPVSPPTEAKAPEKKRKSRAAKEAAPEGKASEPRKPGVPEQYLESVNRRHPGLPGDIRDALRAAASKGAAKRALRDWLRSAKA